MSFILTNDIHATLYSYIVYCVTSLDKDIEKGHRLTNENCILHSCLGGLLEYIVASLQCNNNMGSNPTDRKKVLALLPTFETQYIYTVVLENIKIFFTRITYNIATRNSAFY